MTTVSNSVIAGIEFRQVTKRYGEGNAPLVVKGIDFVVPKGTLTTLLGPSGCGKTTTLRMIAGLETVSSGQILIDGQDVTQLGHSVQPIRMAVIHIFIHWYQEPEVLTTTILPYRE